MKRTLQSILLWVYGAAAASGLLRRGPGRWLFERAYLVYKHLLEAGSTDRLRACVSPGTTAIDVGANIGFYTLPLARWVGPGGRVIALEPERINFARLEARLRRGRLNERVLAVRAVAAEASGGFRLAVNPAHPGDHKLSSEGGEAVQGHALDDLIAAHPGPRVSFVKIDVQGAELRVVRGALDLIGRDRPAMLIEIDPAAKVDGGPATPALLDLLAGLGYRFHPWGRRGPGPAIAAEAVIAAAEAAVYLDLLCLAAGKKD